ncbi:MAG TPA: Co2+/Mg2+ efflux protein ApaG [Flavobacterium sp.]|nr:Co2+/Mg2+ efflux protein ApaG [Flavobacterium sp.]
MVSRITKGIKIVVKTNSLGAKMHFNEVVNFFNYEITIENCSSDTVKLLRRFWLIKETLNEDVVVEGEGVVGVQPVLHPNESFTYTSGSFIKGDVGSMQGYFTMQNVETSHLFHVRIPLFCLNVLNISN